MLHAAPTGLTLLAVALGLALALVHGQLHGDWPYIGSGLLVCVDPETGEARRFLTAPPNREVTGMTMTPDGLMPLPGGRPRSAVHFITEDDRELIGTRATLGGCHESVIIRPKNRCRDPLKMELS